MRSNSGIVFGIAPAKAAFGADREVLRVFSRRCETPFRSFDPVGVMNEPQAEPGFRTQLQIPQRLEIRVVVAIARHRHVDELDGSPDLPADPIGEFDHVAHVGRLDHVLVVGVAVAEMEQQIDVRRHPVAEIEQDVAECLLRLLFGAPVAARLVALEAGEHSGRDVELDRNLVVRQRGCDLVDLALDRLVVDRVDRRVQLVDQIQPDHRVGRHEVDLEFGFGGNLAGVFQPLEHRVRGFRDIGVVQIVEMHVLRRAAGLELVAFPRGRCGMQPENIAGFFQRRALREDRFEPGDPVTAFAGLAVRDALDAAAERRAHRLEHLRRVRHRHAAHKIDVPARHVPHL